MVRVASCLGIDYRCSDIALRVSLTTLTILLLSWTSQDGLILFSYLECAESMIPLVNHLGCSCDIILHSLVTHSTLLVARSRKICRCVERLTLYLLGLLGLESLLTLRSIKDTSTQVATFELMLLDKLSRVHLAI